MEIEWEAQAVADETLPAFKTQPFFFGAVSLRYERSKDDKHEVWALRIGTADTYYFTRLDWQDKPASAHAASAKHTAEDLIKAHVRQLYNDLFGEDRERFRKFYPPQVPREG